jgi:hypothetical protein
MPYHDVPLIRDRPYRSGGGVMIKETVTGNSITALV